MKKRSGKKPRKRPRAKRKYIGLFRGSTMQRRSVAGVYSDTSVEYDMSMLRMLCISCYEKFYIREEDRYKVCDWFCSDCREQVSKRKWSLINTFHNYMAEASYRQTNNVIISSGEILGFTNSIYRCVRGKASREMVIKTIKLSVDLASYTDPIRLGRLLDRYDDLVGIIVIQAKKRQ